MRDIKDNKPHGLKGKPSNHRKPTTKEGHVSFRVKASDKEAWKALADKKDVSLAKLITDVMNNELKHYQ